VKSNYII